MLVSIRPAGARSSPRGRPGACTVDLIDRPLGRYPLASLTEAAWSLRRNLSAYDAFYAALAQGLEAKLATTDRGMATAVSAHTEVEVALLT